MIIVIITVFFLLYGYVIGNKLVFQSFLWLGEDLAIIILKQDDSVEKDWETQETKPVRLKKEIWE